MTHDIEVDSKGVAINWFTKCGKHVVFLPKTDTVDPSKDVDCPKCLEAR
jgi:hypothetical protein